MKIKVTWFVRILFKLAGKEEELNKMAESYEEMGVKKMGLMPPDLGKAIRDSEHVNQLLLNNAGKITGVNSPKMGGEYPAPALWNNETVLTVNDIRELEKQEQLQVENIYWPVSKGNGPGEVTVDPLSQAREGALEEINRQYAIPKELWDKFRTEEQMGKYYRDQLEQYVLDNAQAAAPPNTSAKRYADVVEEALRRMGNVETPPRIHFSHAQDKLVISPSPPDLENDLGVDGCEIPEDMLD